MPGRRRLSVRSGRTQLDHVPLTVETLRAAYDYLNSTPPFNKWNLPEHDDLTFRVARDPNHFGWCVHHGRRRKKPVIAISDKRVGHTLGLMATLAHEMLHLHQFLTGQARGGEHNAAFNKDAVTICRIHGLDPKAF